ncbi:MAG TPA: succinyl-diaminopimelate desuccinylase [Gammaproteobacteria bacterium]|nr:succinyl-diaminopimelate desuccinylase [Gammaproteobacteria bacterium]
MNQDLINLAQKLIQFQSITPHGDAIHQYIKDYLEALSFRTEVIKFEEVSNLWASFGTGSPHILLAGHSDVVPPGDLSSWKHDPFSGTIEQGRLYGRGACDMKGNLAAMMMAAKEIIQSNHFTGTLSLLITSDEEGPAIHGTKRMIPWLKQKDIYFDYTIVGEPSSSQKVGDTLRIGRRGSLNLELNMTQQQHHVAYAPASTAITMLVELLNRLQSIQFKAHPYFPDTQLAITHIFTDNDAHNIIPNQANAWVNIRFNPSDTFDSLKKTLENTIGNLSNHTHLQWIESASPFISAPNKLANAFKTSISNELGIIPEYNTGGGTSDARFLQEISNEIIEFGCLNESAHKIDENILIEDLNKTFRVYCEALKNLQ